MYFKNYEYFLMIAEEGSISKAADKLYLTQPSLSKYLKRLEENLGVELFSRDRYPLALTQAGIIYKRYVEEIRAKERQLQQEFSEFREGLFGHVTLALTEWRSSVMLPALFPYFRERFPHITLSVKEGSHQQMLYWLEHGQADLALMHYPNDYQDLELDFLAQENVIMAVNQNDPLLQKMRHPPRPGEIQHLTTEEFLLFRDAPFILNIEGQNIRQIVLNFFANLNITPNVILEVKGDQTKQNLVQFLCRFCRFWHQHLPERPMLFFSGGSAAPLEPGCCLPQKTPAQHSGAKAHPSNSRADPLTAFPAEKAPCPRLMTAGLSAHALTAHSCCVLQKKPREAMLPGAFFLLRHPLFSAFRL